MSVRSRTQLDRAWQIVVALVMDSRGDWRRKVTEATGLRFSGVRALRRLKDGPMTLRALAEAMTTDAPAATVIVNDLERRGLVRRRVHPEDRRAKIVSLTTAGERVIAIARAVSDQAPDVFDTLPAADVAELVRILEALSRK